MPIIPALGGWSRRTEMEAEAFYLNVSILSGFCCLFLCSLGALTVY